MIANIIDEGIARQMSTTNIAIRKPVSERGGSSSILPSSLLMSEDSRRIRSNPPKAPIGLIITLISVLPISACVHPHHPVLSARHCALGTTPGRANYCHAVHDTDGKVIPGKMQCDPIDACARLDEQTGRVVDVFWVGQANTFDDPDSDEEKAKDKMHKRPWWKFWSKRDRVNED